ncbi:MAG: primosomal replication protein N [Limnobacter sp.]|nr:primosomal replication protein N [Limnobacter sp.]
MDIQDPVNEVTLSGELVERALLRYTPAGIPILDARLAHRCEVAQAGQRRQVEFDIALSFAGPMAYSADDLQLGQSISATGFLAPRRRQSKTLILHVTRFAPLHPNQNR